MLHVTEAHVRSSTAFEVLQGIYLRNEVMASVGQGGIQSHGRSTKEATVEECEKTDPSLGYGETSFYQNQTEKRGDGSGRYGKDSELNCACLRVSAPK